MYIKLNLTFAVYTDLFSVCQLCNYYPTMVNVNGHWVSNAFSVIKASIVNISMLCCAICRQRFK